MGEDRLRNKVLEPSLLTWLWVRRTSRQKLCKGPTNTSSFMANLVTDSGSRMDSVWGFCSGSVAALGIIPLCPIDGEGGNAAYQVGPCEVLSYSTHWSLVGHSRKCWDICSGSGQGMPVLESLGCDPQEDDPPVRGRGGKPLVNP